MNHRAFVKVDKAMFYDFVTRHDDQRFEYEDGYIVQQMTGGTFAHGKIARNFADLLARQVDRSRWEVLQDRGVETPITIRYPDVTIEPVGAASDSLATTMPAVIVEVLSPSSVARDLVRKPGEYASLPSLVAYIVASQDAPALAYWIRRPDGTFPEQPSEATGIDKTLIVSALGLDLTLAEIYAGITFPIGEEAPHG